MGCKNSVCELAVQETINREPHASAKAWADNFSDLYIPKNLARFDDEHKLFVENSLKVMTTCSYSNNKNVLDIGIALHEVIEAIKSLKCKKSCGLDLVSNEHLIHGGAALFEHLTCLFNLFMHNEHIPSEAKCGVIITIPKSGQKQLSSIYKLFDTVVLNRIKKVAPMYNLNLCHHLQNAHQPGLCSLMTSFVLKETMNYFAERGSKTFCCMLDASSAFDTGWYDGLFFKYIKQE